MQRLKPAVIPSGSLKIADDNTTTSGLKAISGAKLSARIPPSIAISQSGFFSSTSFLARFNKSKHDLLQPQLSFPSVSSTP